ncbi:MAG: pyridoxamine 5'-phosphate oxidase family protein [Bacteroidia bacterium]
MRTNLKHLKASSLDKPISLFIQSQTALTIATCFQDMPYCASCYYAFLEKQNAIVFKSSRDTQHIIYALQNKQVAGTITPDKSEVGKIKGIQFSGEFIEPKDDLLKEAKSAYIKKYPFSVAFKGDFWLIELTSIKYTDNTLGFGKKLKWEK